MTNTNFQKGKFNNQYNTVWISNFSIKKCIRINKDQLSEYLLNGWIQRRVINFSMYDINGCKIKKFYTGKSKILIQLCKNVLDIDTNHITFDQISKVKIIIQNEYDSGLSPSMISKKYKISHSNFSMFLHQTLKINLKDFAASYNSGYRKHKHKSKNNKNLKKLYYKECQFKFSPYQEPNIIGFDLLSKYSFSKPQNKEPNTTYLHRDHMVSISYGYENNIPPEHISHPANCEILTEKDNISKSSGCSITYEELLDRIYNWDNGLPLSKISYISNTSKTQSHKNNISKSLKLYYQRKEL